MTKGKAEFLNWLFWMCYLLVYCYVAAMLWIHVLKDIYADIDNFGLGALLAIVVILIGAGVWHMGVAIIEPIADRIFGKYM